MLQQDNNYVYLKGQIQAINFSHSAFGENFYKVTLASERLSNTIDYLPLIVSERIISDDYLNQRVEVFGQMRSYNQRLDQKIKLIVYVFVDEIRIIHQNEQDDNIVKLTGFFCKEPIFRVTPKGRAICDLLIAVNRQCNKSDYIPCIAWGRNAEYLSKFPTGNKISLTGRFQSREYYKNLETKMAYEVSIEMI